MQAPNRYPPTLKSAVEFQVGATLKRASNDFNSDTYHCTVTIENRNRAFLLDSTRTSVSPAELQPLQKARRASRSLRYHRDHGNQAGSFPRFLSLIKDGSARSYLAGSGLKSRPVATRTSLQAARAIRVNLLLVSWIRLGTKSPADWLSA